MIPIFFICPGEASLLSTRYLQNVTFRDKLTGTTVGADSDDDRIVSHDAFFQKHHSISQSWQIPSWNKVVFSSPFFLICFPVKVRKFHYFVIWHDFSDFQWLESEVSKRTYIFMVSISLRITKCSVTHNKVMNIQDFLEYMLKSSKCGRHASKNEVLNIVQAKKYPEVPTFWRLFCRPKMA